MSHYEEKLLYDKKLLISECRFQKMIKTGQNDFQVIYQWTFLNLVLYNYISANMVLLLFMNMKNILPFPFFLTEMALPFCLFSSRD